MQTIPAFTWLYCQNKVEASLVNVIDEFICDYVKPE